jgi:Glycosyl transferases group 1
VDVTAYRPRPDPRSGASADLVWVGSSSTLPGVAALAPILEVAAGHLPHLRLKLICDRFFSLRAMPVQEIPWSPETETTEIASADIGISCIPDDPWSRGKCGLKILQYMAAGLPVIANPVGVHPEIVRHGETGFLASTPEEWLAALRRLAENPQLRHRMGQAGRVRVEQFYSVEAGAKLWLNALEQLRHLRATA